MFLRSGKLKLASMLALVASLFFATVAGAVPGAFDLTFSGDGRVNTSFTTTSHDWAFDTAVQPDGKIVVAGAYYNGKEFDFAVARYTSSGKLDTTFSGDGKATIDFDPTKNDYAKTVYILPSGKILLVGYIENSAADNDVAVARFNSNGTPDLTFAGDAKTVIRIGAGEDEGHAVTVQPNGKILIAGNANVGGKDIALLIRLNSSGTLDTKFGDACGTGCKTGYTTFAFWPNIKSIARGVAYTASSQIVVGGFIQTATTSGSDFALARFNSDGSSDLSFGGGFGRVLTDFGGYEQANAMYQQADGSIILAGYTYDPDISLGDFALVRYYEDGTIDSGFGSDGIVITDMGSDEDRIMDVTVDSLGNVIAAGYVAAETGYFVFGVARYDASGMLDTSFSGDGMQYARFFTDRDAFAQAVTVQSNDKIIVAGYGRNASGNDDFLVLRLLAY